MAATFAESWLQISNICKLFDTIRTDGQTSVITHLDTYLQAVEGDYAPQAIAAMDGVRTSYAGLLSAARSAILPHLRDVALAINTKAQPPSRQFWVDLNAYMVTNDQDVNSRNITFGTISAGGSNVGDGTVYRLEKDLSDFEIENVWLDVVTAKVITDQNNGALVGREVLSLSHGKTLRDRLSEAGSGLTGTLTGIAGDNGILKNASFQTLTGTATVPTAIPNWTSSVTVNATNYQFDESNYFRSSPEEKSAGTSRSLQINVTATLQQKMSTLRRSLNQEVPHFALLRYNRTVGSSTGTLVLRMGAHTASVVLAAQSGWQTLALALDKNCYYELFNEDDLDLMIDWTHTGGTGLLVDDVQFGPMTEFDKLWYFYAGGATHSLRDDLWTFTDALGGAEGVIQAWLWRAFPEGMSLRSINDGTETISDI